MPDEPPKRTRTKRKLGKSYIEECRALREKILEERGGEPVPDTAEVIRHMREDDPRGFWCRD